MAYSAARYGLSRQWCIFKERGLILPDVVFWLDVDPFSDEMRCRQREELTLGCDAPMNFSADDLREIRRIYAALHSEVGKNWRVPSRAISKMLFEIVGCIVQLLKQKQAKNMSAFDWSNDQFEQT